VILKNILARVMGKKKWGYNSQRVSGDFSAGFLFD
jgi:hypothetical protein